MKFNPIIFVLCVILGLVAVADEVAPVPMHSFRPPYSTGRAGIRWWNYGGDVTIFQNYIRLTQEQQSQIGYIWNKNPLTIKDWKATVSFKIDGKSRLGGDGIAFWYVAKPGTEGKAFGSLEQFKGLGVFIDTFDNDNKRDNPYISVIVNDGSLTFDPMTDGKDIQVGGCRASARKTNDPVLLHVQYIGSTKELKVSYDLGGSGGYHECYTGIVDLPTGYYLGLSAATGGVFDNQDINYFELRRLDGDGTQPPINNRAEGFATPQEQKAAKEMENLKQELEALRKMDSAPKNEEAAKKVEIPAADVPGRISQLEGQLKQMEEKLAAITKVANGIDAISTTIEQLKKRLDENDKAVPSVDIYKLRGELTKQQQELSRITTNAQESILKTVKDRLEAFESNVIGIQKRVDDVILDAKKNGGSSMNIIMIIVMVAESCLLLFMFMKGRNNTNKYDKMW